MEKHYYITKIISIIGILFSCYLIYNFAYGSYTLVNFQKTFNTTMTTEEIKHFDSIIGLSALIGIAGIIGLIGSIGLFLFKRLGFYTMCAFVLSLWVTSWMVAGGISQDWFWLSIFSLIFIYLIWQRKFILNYKKGL